MVNVWRVVDNTRLRRFHTVLVTLFTLTIASITVRADAEELPALLVVFPSGPAFDLALEGLDSELGELFAISKLSFDSTLTTAQLEKKITAVVPRIIVLMGNKPIRLYKEYIGTFKSGKNDIPVVALLASQMGMSVEGLTNIRGISYETPMVTALISYRNVIGRPVTRVGVVYRTIFEPFVKEHTEFCKREKMDVVGVWVSNDPKTVKKALKKALAQLFNKEKIEVCWILNDNMLLTHELLQEVWIPVAAEHSLPLIVGVESLVQPQLQFGTFAVMPEPKAMGEQAAQIVMRLEDTEWKFEGVQVYPAISVYTVLNMKKAGQVLDVKKLKLNDVTNILKDSR